MTNQWSRVTIREADKTIAIPINWTAYMTKFPRHFDQLSERLKLQAVVVARKLGGLANDTKWKELVETCHAMDWQGPLYRYKCIDSDNISALSGEWHAVPFPFNAIEWLDMTYAETIRHGVLLLVENIDHSREIEVMLKKIGLDYKKGKEFIRIFGYAPRNEECFHSTQDVTP